MNEKLIKSTLLELVPQHSQERAYFFQHLPRYSATLGLLGGIGVSNKNILDVGIIPGHLARACLGLGARKVIGLDYDPDRFGFRSRLEKAGVEILKCDIDQEHFPIESGSIDIVIFTEVIEHLYYPTVALSEIRRVLAPGGQMVLTTPNIANLANRFRGILRRPIYPAPSQMGDKPQQQHHKEYSRQELNGLLESNSFQIIKSGYIAGTEQALLSGAMPMRLPWIIGGLYAILPLLIPPWRSYLYFVARAK